MRPRAAATRFSPAAPGADVQAMVLKHAVAPPSYLALPGPPLVADVLQRIDALLPEHPGGFGRLLVLRGEPAGGLTLLTDAIVTLARTRGVACARAVLGMPESQLTVMRAVARAISLESGPLAAVDAPTTSTPLRAPPRFRPRRAARMVGQLLTVVRCCALLSVSPEATEEGIDAIPEVIDPLICAGTLVLVVDPERRLDLDELGGGILELEARGG